MQPSKQKGMKNLQFNFRLNDGTILNFTYD